MNNKSPIIPSTLNWKTVNALLWSSFYLRDLTWVTIPNSITTIWSYAFSYNNGITNVILPNALTRIEDWVFNYCSLSTITIPNNVTSIWSKAFFSNQLVSVTIPNNVTSIWSQAFYWNKLASITITSGVTNIWNSAFANQFTFPTLWTVYWPASWYVKNSYTTNFNDEFDKVKLPNYVWNQP